MPLSVVLLTSSPVWRGSGTSFAKIARGLERAGHRATVLARTDAVRARFAAEGVDARSVPLERTGWRGVRAVAGMVRAVAADLVLVDTPRDVRVAAFATALRPVPLVFRYNLSRRVLPADLWSRLLFRRVGAIAYQSAYASDRALRTSPWLATRRGEVILNGYDGGPCQTDLAAVERFRRAHNIGSARTLVLSGAALSFHKGYATAIEALARIAAVRPVDYVICGAGDDAAAIAALAEQARLPVRFIGLVSRADWVTAVDAADIVLHPGAGELFGNVVAEAMLRARAVVAIDSGATPELIGRGPGAGLMVPEGHVAAMTDALLSLVDDPARRRAMGAAARSRILSEFPLEAMEGGYVRLIEGLCGPP